MASYGKIKIGLIFGFIVMGLVAISGTCYAAEVSCIEAKLADINGIIPGAMPKKEELKGYSSVETVSGEDDGGGYLGKKYIFSDHEVTIVRGRVDSIVITSPNILWAAKIRLGQERSETEKHLSSYRVYTDDKLSQYLVCSNYGDVYAIVFYRQGKIEKIEVALDRP